MITSNIITSGLKPGRFFRGVFAPTTFLTVVLALAACAAPRVPMKTTRPANVPEAARLRSLAVMPFNGSHGGEVAARLEASLAQVKVGNESYFSTVSGSQQTSRSINNVTAAPSGVEVQRAVQLGRQLHVAGVFAGDVLALNVNRDHYSQERSRCLDKKCKNTQTWNVSCEKRDARVEVAPRLIEVATGNVVYATRSVANKTDKGCSDETPMASPDSLLSSALDEAIANIIKDVAPQEQTNYVILKDEMLAGDSAAKNRFDSGLKFVRAGDPDRGCRIWNDMETDGIHDPNLSYNLAACSAEKGDVQTALRIIEDAYQQLQSPDSDFLETRQRYQKLVDEAPALAKQLGPPR